MNKVLFKPTKQFSFGLAALNAVVRNSRYCKYCRLSNHVCDDQEDGDGRDDDVYDDNDDAVSP